MKQYETALAKEENLEAIQLKTQAKSIKSALLNLWIVIIVITITNIYLSLYSLIKKFFSDDNCVFDTNLI